MIHAAGICLVAPGDEVLLMRRTDGAGWAFPGGGLEGEETTEEAARREFEEETGKEFTGALHELQHEVRGDVDFTTFLGHAEVFIPALNPEHDAYAWARAERALDKANLHPGARTALQRYIDANIVTAMSLLACAAQY